MAKEDPKKRGHASSDVGAFQPPETPVERTQPAQSKKQAKAQERAETVARWYAEDAFRTVTTFLGTPSVNWLAAGFVRPTPTARILEWVSRDFAGNVEPYGIGAAVDAMVGAGQPGSAKYRGLCLVHIQSLQEVRAVVDRDSPVAAELKGIELVEATDPHSWSELQQAVQGMDPDRWAFAVQAPEDVHQQLGLSGKPRVFDSKDVVAVPRRCIDSCIQALAGLARKPSPANQVVIALTSVPETWLRSWMWEEKKQEIREFIDGALDAVDLSKSQMPTDARGSLTRVHELWQTVRGEVKDRLEQVIAALAEQRYETFEEKAAVADAINQSLDEWGFRAINPATGRAAHLRVRRQERNPNGQFYFQEIASSKAVAEGDPKSPKTPVALPAFRLTEPPPDRRERTE